MKYTGKRKLSVGIEEVVVYGLEVTVTQDVFNELCEIANKMGTREFLSSLTLRKVNHGL